MKCCGNEGEAPELEVEYELHKSPVACYRCSVKCSGCYRDTTVRVMRNDELTYAQHREFGRLTLEDRTKNGLTGTLYITYPYPSDFES